MTGIPVYNTNNNCATGSTALYLAQQLVVGGQAECVMALGFEKMQKGALQMESNGVNPLGVHISSLANFGGSPITPVTPWMFGLAAREHMKQYGTTKEQFARVAEKNHRHSANNPRAQFQKVYTLEEIMESKEIFDPLTKLQCSPTSDGAAAAIVCSKDFVKAHNLEDTAVEISAMKMATDVTKSFESASGICGYHMTQKATRDALAEADVKVEDVQVVELHDCFSSNELITYEALGLCGDGEGGKLIDEGQVTFGGKWVVNPSGGLISKGHPLGATGLAQCAEICWQLRKDEEVENRQVEGATVGLQHNLGLGGACVVGVYKR
ncbi:sterol carrier protein 2-like [Sycon ciliatum]|uniref:sterol carrier protein 2-like n=1 Tax=Sycon ciliatum TaxID=27933 RepID=UPI0031F61220